MEKIKNTQIYVNRMQKGMEDKLFFVSSLQHPPILIDYGCADGSLIQCVKTICPDAICYGFDNNTNMLQLAKKNLAEFEGINIHSSSQLSILKTSKKNPEKYNLQTHDEVFLLSSVLHEVYSYCTPEDIERFWNEVRGIDVGCIAIRDMCFQASSEYPSQFHSFEEFYNKFLEGVKKNKLEGLWEDYRKVYPESPSYHLIVHFLLKYKYVENWDREVKENYFGTKWKEVMRIFLGYDVAYEEHYILPYIQEMVKKDFDIVLDCCTHCKLLLKKKC